MFSTQRQQPGGALRADSFATSAVEVLPGVPLPRSAVAEIVSEPVPAEPAPAEPVPVVVPVAQAPASPAPAPVVAAPPAGWYPDPSGQFAHRYWTGAAWTEHTA